MRVASNTAFPFTHAGKCVLHVRSFEGLSFIPTSLNASLVNRIANSTDFSELNFDKARCIVVGLAAPYHHGFIMAIYLDLLEKFDGNKFPHWHVQSVADKHGVTRRTVNRYWRLGQLSGSPENVLEAIKSKTKDELVENQFRWTRSILSIKLFRNVVDARIEVHLRPQASQLQYF